MKELEGGGGLDSLCVQFAREGWGRLFSVMPIARPRKFSTCQSLVIGCKRFCFIAGAGGGGGDCVHE